MSGLAHYLEREGLATVVIALVPQHARRMRPPRTLAVPFELGRPLGGPHLAVLQTEVLRAAFDLLDQAGPGPLFETFETDVAPASAADTEIPWSCPVSFDPPSAEDSLLQQLLHEVRLLRPWHDRASRDRGHTGADLSGLDIEAACEWLGAFAGDSVPDASPVAGRNLAETFKLACEDLKAFYLEAATIQPGSGDARTVNDWFWQETAAAKLLWTLRERLAEHPDTGVRLHARATLVPEAQVAKRRPHR